ncbi:endonuclease/exonuclease/phosphatase family protein [Indivirus ILV1]|uniref:Endonuclease/exonuclease/phosphatase family protein n=1 Tax=Indivirus ILV1 TaxID=1977633 RepID=A0A1V0SDP3_9VIRU|nr:endonuclease/exonuclease/phosphatase family protein [Indivirus ILV1]
MEYFKNYKTYIAVIIVVCLLYILYNNESIEYYNQLGGANKRNRIKFMQFNIENGGTLIDFSKVIKIIKSTDADVVAIEEANGNMHKIAKESGYPYYDNRTQIMSHYPIINPGDAYGIYVLIEMEPNKVIAVSNVHLPSDPYGPEELHKGESYRKVTKLEKSLRLYALQRQIKTLPKLMNENIPIFLAGDFNSPSHLDCKETEEKCFIWPISLTLEKLGFKDSYREIYSDANENHGYTWWADRPKVKDDWNPGPNDKHDRIDFIYIGGPVKPERFQIIGEKDISPWPSDHRAIVLDCSVKLARSPIYVAVNHRMIEVGNKIKIKYYTSKNNYGNIIAIRNNNSNQNVKEIMLTNKLYGEIEISLELKEGNYNIVLLNNKNKSLSETPLIIKPKNAKVELKTNKKIYNIGEPITVYWEYGPGNRFDWIIIQKEDAPKTEDMHYWHSTQSEINGSHTFSKTTLDKDKWPLDPGIYDIKYMVDDSYEIIASIKIHIQ